MPFTVYKSSAGSGKTFTLVKEYLKIALADEAIPPRAYRNILAITFTNKAAAEMKERIIGALRVLSQEKENENPLRDALISEMKLSSSVLKERAMRMLKAILHNYSDFAIGTIDSFIHRVLRSFAFDLKLSYTFEVETDSDKLLTLAIDELIGKIGSDEKLSELLIEFAEGRAMEEKSWHIEYELKNFAHAVLKEDGTEHLENLKTLTLDDFFSIRRELNKSIAFFENEIKSYASGALEAIKKQGLDMQDFYQGRNGIFSYFERLAGGNLDKLLPGSHVKKTVEEDKWTGAKADEKIKTSVNVIKEELLSNYEKIRSLYQRDGAEYRLFILLRRSIYSMAVLNELEKIISGIKKKQNILHISEFSKIISGIVLSQPVPFLYERLGEKYANYLVDEFQDTSVLQFQNLLPLIDNSLAQNHFTMLVGDGKQAIYRWRGGEVEQFADLPRVSNPSENPYIKERGESLQRHYIAKNLSRNFRSKAEIVQFNNLFFRSLAAHIEERYRNIYDELEQEFDPRNTGGYVQVRFSGKEEDHGEKAKAETLSIIRDLLKQGYHYADITLLVRKNTEGNTLAGFLSENNIPVISGDSLLLKSSRKVNFITAALEYLRNPSNSIARAVMLHYCCRERKEDPGDFIPLSRAGIKEFTDFFLSRNIGLHLSFLQNLSIYELCEEIVKIFSLEKEYDPYVSFFLEQVLNFTRRNPDSLNDFLQWWNLESTQPSVVTPEGLDAVSIMTIHRSKGLEFPVVILPFAGWKTDTGRDKVWVRLSNKKIPALRAALLPVSKSLEETEFAEIYREEKSKSVLDNLNLLYVAFTRAEERLYVLSPHPGSNPAGFHTAGDMIAFSLLQATLCTAGQALYETGAIPEIPPRTPEKSSLFGIPHIPRCDWREHLKLRHSAGSRWISSDSRAQRDYGILIHDILEKITVADDLPEVLNTYQAGGILDETEKNNLAAEMEELFASEPVKKIFSLPGIIKKEAEILLPGGNLFRPDRLVISGKKAFLIDFKTGKRSESHKQQLRQYEQTLLHMGFETVEKYLLYTREKAVEHF